jgi:hypothetical protein
MAKGRGAQGGGKGKRSPSSRRGTTWEAVCRFALTLPGVNAGTSYRTPALFAGKRFLARLKEDGETVAIRVDYADREVLLEADSRAFYLTDHYRPYPAMLVRLKEVPKAVMEKLVEEAWRRESPKRGATVWGRLSSGRRGRTR